METIPCISVVILAYNAGKYIEKCIESIISQDFIDMEIIIINDGSTDNTKEICEKYVKMDNRIKLTTTENRGAGSARNTGISKAQGTFIALIESDDYNCDGYFSRMYKMITETNSDIAEGHYKRVNTYDEEVFTNTGEQKVLTNMEKLLVIYGEDEGEYINSVIVTNKLYRK